MSEKNEVLTSVILVERLIPRLYANSRETIKRSGLMQIATSLNMVLKLLSPVCKEPMVLTPIMEVTTLIDTVTEESTFVETDNETKTLLVERMNDALNNLYVFAGKYYTSEEFEFNIGKLESLKNIVDGCIKNGYYFGWDTKLQQEGAV